MEYEISSYYQAFWGALQRKKNELQEIINEIENFDLPKDEVDVYVSKFHFSLETAEKFILNNYFAERTNDIRISIVLFSSFFIEGFFNEVLAIKSGSKSQFKKSTSKISSKGKSYKMTLFERILEAPLKFYPEYTISDKHIKLLKELIIRRNYFAHDEPTIIQNGEVVFEGKGSPINEGYKELFEWTQLPKYLSDNLLQHESDNFSPLNHLKYNHCFDRNYYKKVTKLEEIGSKYLE